MEKYAFLMVDFETPRFIKDIQNRIGKQELYIPENPEEKFSYGLETETHATIAPCLDNDTDLNELKKYLFPLSEYKTMISDVSIFYNDEYDVLKCNVRCDALHRTNAEIKKHFELHTEFKEYHPHITIAYLKKGYAEKYVMNFIPQSVFLTPKFFSYGLFEGEEYKRITFK